VLTVKAIHDPVGEEGDVLGTCYNCHIHACGHHADRSADDAQFLCVLCVKTLLTASAFTRTPHTDYARELLRGTNNERLISLQPSFRFISVRDFSRAHPRMWTTITQNDKWTMYRTGEGISGSVLEALDEEGRRLLAAAIVLSLILRIPKEAIEGILLEASEELAAEAPDVRG